MLITVIIYYLEINLILKIFNVQILRLGRYKTILGDHKGFVQGVAWDPLDKYIATLSSDR